MSKVDRLVAKEGYTADEAVCLVLFNIPRELTERMGHLEKTVGQLVPEVNFLSEHGKRQFATATFLIGKVYFAQRYICHKRQRTEEVLARACEQLDIMARAAGIHISHDSVSSRIKAHAAQYDALY